jgi:hypothetical protein
MSVVFLDLDQIDTTADYIGTHAAEAESIAREVEAAGAVAVPPSLRGWLEAEIAEIATTVRMAALVYLVASVDALTRAEALRTNQSLVTALPVPGAPTPAFVETGFVLGQAELVGTSYAAPAQLSGFVLGQAEPTTGPFGGSGFLLGLPGPNTPLGGYTPSLGGTSSIGDIPGYNSTNRTLLSTPGRTHIGGNTYYGSGMTGSYDYVLPNPGHEE